MSGAPIRTVGRYDLLEVIGRGGAAVVYLAHQRDLRRRVALKELAPFQAAADPTFAGRFAEESRVAGSLSHPNIVTVHEYFEHDGVPYIAMEYLSQGSLRPYIGTLTVAQIAGVLEGILAGLAHGQLHSVVHRDLKPENLLVTADGRVKIADFGVARAYVDAVTRPVVTAAGTTIGTPAYMAPEQALGRPVGPAADLYSLGIVAWELLVGRVPFEEKDTPVAVLYRHVHEPIPPAGSVAPDVDPRIEAWLGRMLAKDPDERFAGAEAAWEELEDVVLDLLGPRWRRDARLPVLETSVAGRPLTPAVFNEGAPGAPPRRAEPTVDGVATPDPGAPVAGDAGGLVAGEPWRRIPGRCLPMIPEPGGRPTMHRLARRHDLEAAAPAEPVKPGVPRGVAVAAVLAAIAVAIVLGLVVGSSGGTRAPAPKTTPTLSPATQAAQVVGVLNGVASESKKELARLKGVGAHPLAYASAATRLQRAYTGGVRKLAKLPAATRNAPQAKAIDATLKRLAGLYGSLAKAARARSVKRDARVGTQITAAERTLRTETDALT
jgi:hypothetical protein